MKRWPWKRKRRSGTAERLAMLTRVARELTAGLDLMGVLRRTLALSVQAVDATVGNLLLLDEEGRLALAVALYGGKFQRGDLEAGRKALQEGLTGWVVQNRRPVLVDDVEKDPRGLRVFGATIDYRPGAVVCAPLLLPHRVVGVLTCIHTRTDHFGEADLQTLQFIADQAAVALENARLFAAEEQRRELSNTLSEIARVITATLDLDEVLNLILEQLGRVIPYDSASIFLLHNRRLDIRAWRGFEDVHAVQRIFFGLGGGHIMARVVAGREPLVCADVQQEEGWENVPGLPPIRGWIGAPLVARGEVVGALTVDSHELGAYSDADARVVAAFADHAAIAVANAWLWQQAQRRLDEIAFLYETGQAMTASLELDDVLRSLMNRVREYFRMEAASVAMVDEETGDLVFRVAAGAAAADVVGMRLKAGQGVAGWVASSGQPALVPAVRRDKRFYQGVDEKTGFHTRALMAVPIKLGQKTIGVIEAINPQEGRLEDGDLRLLMNVATLAASAIQNARHFTRARDAEQRYASLFENSADPIIITDASGLVIDVNRKMCEMLGYEKEDLLGRDIASLHRDPDATRERLAQALEGESIFYNVETAAHDGTFLPFEVRATRVFHGDIPFVQWVCHDLMERLKLERVRQDLTHMIIHDLRNPLSSIMSSLDLIRAALMDKTITIPMDQLFTIAERSGQRLYLLIDSILDLARLEDGRAKLARKRLNVRHMVQEVMDQARPTATARELHLDSRIPARLPSLLGDRDLLQRVLLNLLDNAMKFTPPGGRIRVEVGQPDADTLLFAVSDTGPGIPPEHHERIFEQFTRLERKGARGTGLGLALCRLAVEAHGGRIWVESEPGRGATFKFVLPVGEEDEGEA
ncbi:MAG TPA: GAF domain-containing protein [Anaerolineales bacterium]|nr:GAF domain-containing protein [Anaerolineales bacterium]